MDIRETLINGYWKVYLIITYSIYIDLCHGDFIVYAKKNHYTYCIVWDLVCLVGFLWVFFVFSFPFFFCFLS
jgi:hypothetical protein